MVPQFYFPACFLRSIAYTWAQTILQSLFSMSKTDRIKHSLREIITPAMIEFVQNASEDFGVVAVSDITLSADGKYADVFVSSERHTEKLPKILSPFGKQIRRTIGKSLSVYTAPIIRFRAKMETGESGKTVLQIIQELEHQYDLSAR